MAALISRTAALPALRASLPALASAAVPVAQHCLRAAAAAQLPRTAPARAFSTSRPAGHRDPYEWDRSSGGYSSSGARDFFRFGGNNVHIFRPHFGIGWGLLSLMTAGIAQGKNRGGLNWWLLSLLLGPVALFALVAFCDKLPDPEARNHSYSGYALPPPPPHRHSGERLA